MAIIRKYGLGALYKYRHFSQPSADVLDKFWSGPDVKADFIVYDYPLGAGRPAPDNATPTMRDGWQYLNQLKADMIIFSGEKVFICEIKPTMDAGAFGQLLVYRALYQMDHGYDQYVVGVIICEVIHPDLIKVAQLTGIDVIQATDKGVTYANRSSSDSFYNPSENPA